MHDFNWRDNNMKYCTGHYTQSFRIYCVHVYLNHRASISSWHSNPFVQFLQASSFQTLNFSRLQLSSSHYLLKSFSFFRQNPSHPVACPRGFVFFCTFVMYINLESDLTDFLPFFSHSR